MTPTLRQLEIFAQMIASGSIAECASELGVPEAVIESDLEALEERLGHKLFTVENGWVRLTPAGRKTVDAMAVLAEIEPEQWDSPSEAAAVESEADVPTPHLPEAEAPDERAAPEPEAVVEEPVAGIMAEEEAHAFDLPNPLEQAETAPAIPESVFDAVEIEPVAYPPLKVVANDLPEVVDAIVPEEEPETLPQELAPEMTPEMAEVSEASPAEETVEQDDLQPDTLVQAEALPETEPETERVELDPVQSALADVHAMLRIVEDQPKPRPFRPLYIPRETREPRRPLRLVEREPAHEPEVVGESLTALWSEEIAIPEAAEDTVEADADPVMAAEELFEDADGDALLLTEQDDVQNTDLPEIVEADLPEDDLLELTELADPVVREEELVQARSAAVATPRSLAVHVAFRAPAPASAPHPTVVALFAPVAVPEPANDPEPSTPAVAPPVLDLRNARQQQVTVAAHPAVFGHFQEALTAFEQANPDVAITLELDAFTAMRAEPLLAAGQVDIVYYYAMGERERFESRYVWSESVSIFIGENHPLADRDAVTIEDLVPVRPVLLGSRNGLRPILDNAMQRGGIDLWEPVLETDNLFSIMTAVRDGQGYFAAFGPIARDFGRMEGIRRLPLVDPLPSIEVRQAVRYDMRDDPVVASLAEYLFR
jgi:DNA-binding transcriptional LysR family regulator